MRTVLYADPEVSKLIRERFVAHWSSERPVPKVTIDFGDGRVLHRTVTGNSAHYFLDSQGRVLDVLPGVYPPLTFLREAKAVLPLATQLRLKVKPEDFARALSEHHARILKEELGNRLVAVESDTGSDANVEGLVERSRRAAQQANEYLHESRLSFSTIRLIWRDLPKEHTRKALGNVVANDEGALSDPKLDVGKSASTFRDAISDRPLYGGPLRYPAVADASAISLSKMALDAPGIGSLHRPPERQRLGSVVTRAMTSAAETLANADPFLAGRVKATEANLAGDAAISELVLRPMIRRWFVEQGERTFYDLNRRVFAEAFLTPRDDPWLGLLADGLWTGIRDDGVQPTESSGSGK